MRSEILFAKLKKASAWIAVSLASFIIFAGAAIVYAAWQDPTQSPPNGNVPAPLNVGTGTQTLLGSKRIERANPAVVLSLGTGLGVDGVFRGYSNGIFDGNVGIGTINPGATLTVRKNSPVFSLTPDTVTGQSVMQMFTKDDNGDGLFQSGDKGWHVTARGDNFSAAAERNALIFWKYDNGYNSVLTLDNDGDVVLGATESAFRFHVMSKIYQSGGGTIDQTVVLQASNNVPMPQQGQSYRPENNSPGINFANSDGAFLGALGLAGWSGAWGNYGRPRDITLASYDGNLILGAGHSSGSPLEARVFIKASDGNVGIGTNNPGGYRLYVQGPLAVNGNADKPGGGSWGTLSDGRLKDVISEFDDGLDKIIQLQPIIYHYKKDNPVSANSETEYIGFIAQDVQKVLPQAVRLSDQGYLVIENDAILWTMLNAIKELKAENDMLKKRLDAIEQSLAK